MDVEDGNLSYSSEGGFTTKTGPLDYTLFFAIMRHHASQTSEVKYKIVGSETEFLT